MKKYKVRYQDLSIKNKKKKLNYIRVLKKVMQSGQFLMGPELYNLEKKISYMCDRKYAVGTASGTDALYLSLRAIGIKKGDEVITTPLSWVSSSNAIVLNQATPVFVDIKDDLNIDEKKIQKKITKKTKAILFVNFTGNTCNFKELVSIAKKNNLKLIEDAAQSFGSYESKQISGSVGDISCFSINPMKILSSFGESGMILTNNKNYFKKINILRYVGTINKENCIYPSLNFKMDTLQAGFILENLKNVKSKIKIRNKLAKEYIKKLTKKVQIPIIKPQNVHSFYSFTILANKRDELKNYLEKNGIETKIKHKPLIPHQKAYSIYFKNDIPNAERIIKKILCLPLYEGLSISKLNYIVKNINKFYN